ncbi:uncharacterized protein LOC124364414 isoform X2 [Homalodisca vitripennis]|uniref:uncharacterized protein LOC124364414 isoform X2 n=1 Tax=Homalodisca vitripennis TaxID=197043 RepID=UPI001EE9E7C0|nr:uncharacterized protein LOC124364414 isoform X2 [Homalodisca vitripennis]
MFLFKFIYLALGYLVMRPRIYTCCFGCTTLRAGCIIISWFTMIISVIYLFNVIISMKRYKGKGDPDDPTRDWVIKYGAPVSLTTSLIFLVSGIIILVGVFKDIAFFIAIAIALYVFIVIGFLGLAGSALAGDSTALFIQFLFCMAICLYCTLVLSSYLEDMRDNRNTTMQVQENEENPPNITPEAPPPARSSPVKLN